VAELAPILAAIGFRDGHYTEDFDCFGGTSAMEKLGESRRPRGANLFARKR
jgi:hypothetical protein